MHVLATAGHVDHGKSTLVHALTGQDPDRLAEEKRRGLTIELGYCWTRWEPLGDVAFVDVPGHEKFVTTMLAGVGPVPFALLVVAADDPWMPQADEHLAALDALGVEYGLLVVTRTDLADPARAAREARTRLHRTSLRHVPDVAVSARTGAGMTALRDLLVQELTRVPPADPAADPVLWIDRRFHVRGAGTVVTGTLRSGTLRVGDLLEADGSLVRVRGMEALGSRSEQASAPARVALDLGSAAPTEARRGHALVAPDTYLPCSTIDVRLRTAPERHGLPRQPALHVGSARVEVRARLLAPDVARLVLSRPLPVRYADRGLLRDPGSRDVWGVEVLDPDPPRHRRDIALHDGTPGAELRLRGPARLSRLARLGVPLDPLPTDAVVAGDWILPGERAKGLRAELGRLCREHPVAPAEAAHKLGLPAPELASALVAPPLGLAGGRIVGPTSLTVPEAWRVAAGSLLSEVSGFEAPPADRLAEVGLDDRALATLHRAGLLLRVDQRVVLAPGSDEAALTVLRALPQPFTASQARQALGTSRRVVLPLLAHLDRTGRTLRLPDDRRQVRPSS